MNLTSKLTLLIILIICLTLIGCSDSDDTVTNPPVIDTAPPAVPTGLATSNGDNVVKLSWDPNVTDSDFLGFNVYRLNSEQSWDLTATPISSSSYIDCNPLDGQCLYRVTSVDLTGNESAWAQIAVVPWSPDTEIHRP